MDIICLSHLKWEETLFQRPQQLMLRLAASGQARVLYLASCGTRDYCQALLHGNGRLMHGRVNDRLSFCNIPYLPLSRRFHFLRALHLKQITATARHLARRMNFRDPLLWVYYPAYIDHIGRLPHSRLVYDCMDLFRGFQSSGRNIQEQEDRLLRRADIVFTGGRSLQRSKEGINPRTYCFPSGVDYAHFHQAALEATPIPPEMAALKRPILGYFGAIDERIDFELVRYLCRQRPETSVVFLGPVIGDATPPIAEANFHYLGPKRYAELPNYLKAFDVCLMPFAQSELTRHISPTKTPEYLAGGKPVVSTPVPDVIADYADVAAIAGTYEEFVQAVDEALTQHDPALHEKFLAKAEARSWETIAAEMLRIVQE